MQSLDLSENARWKQRFRAARLGTAQLAEANPTRGLVISNQSGIFQLYGWDVPTGTLHQLTDLSTGITFGGISPDGAWVYYLQDEGGSEIGHYVRVPFGGGTPQDITPLLNPYASWSLGENRGGGVLLFTTASESGFQVFMQDWRVHADDASPADKAPVPRLLYRGERLLFSAGLSHDAELAVVASSEHSGKNAFSLIALDPQTGSIVAELYDKDASITPLMFSPVRGDLRVLANSDVSGFARPLLWHPRSGERFDLPLGDLPGDVSAWDWSPDGQNILLCQLHQAQYRLLVYHLADGSLTVLDQHPGGTLGWVGGSGGGFFAPDGEIFALWQDAAHAPRLVALDAADGAVKRTVLSAGDVPRGTPWRSVTFASGDTQIQAWLAAPPGDGPFPTILHTHGGPTSVTTEMFHPLAQTWLDHGFAFISVNYRGSTTFGKDFERAIWGRLGSVEVEDMAAAYDYVVRAGIAQADAVLLTGGSYGGFLTLQALGKRPDLWAGGMAQVAIADWWLMYEDQAETLRGYQRALFGGTPQDVPEATRAASPITYAAQVAAPLLVIQGENDTRCPARQMRAYEDTLKAQGKDITVHWFDAGHGSRANEQQIEHMELMLRFAYRVLG